MKVTVVNKFKVSNNIYCGRGTPLGNPFPIGPSQNRDQVCDNYENWFYQHIDEPNFLNYIGDYDVQLNPQMSMLRNIYHKALEGDINLGCFCAPKRCHCETIKTFIENKLEENLK